MKNDAFTGGVEPGGLWSQSDIRILICYVLKSAGAPLSGEDLSKVLQGRALANYFETRDALAALEAMGNVERDGSGCYTVTAAGREIADSLDATLPLSVRDKALEAAVTLLAEARSQRENQVEITETDKGFRVDCHISGGDMELMGVSLYVPDRGQAELVKRNFHRDPEGVYRMLLSLLTGDGAFARSYFEEKEAGRP